MKPVSFFQALPQALYRPLKLLLIANSHDVGPWCMNHEIVNMMFTSLLSYEVSQEKGISPGYLCIAAECHEVAEGPYQSE